ncbi:hypothetical protein [Marinilabilia rubra]|uniref:Glycosyl hydrolase family 30 beta sandwich domain-containing protein n=1 Tax=Marinilabilia rubra TaxID=2162893 RepID=A0A2U2BE73_9BACT|nr:hypothetical protein [Marinilabilia rubra]PWE01374.1 hypothetical protein DDZ16_02495 [Marinilabilia rubra]
MKKIRINKFFRFFVLLGFLAGCSEQSSFHEVEESNNYVGSLKSADLTAEVDPSTFHQEVTFGGDGKLTIKDWAEKDVSTTSQLLFGDMQLKVLRVPIFALQDISDPIYDNVITVIQAVQNVNPNVEIFASIANGDGYGNHYHGADKFPNQWIGCCPYNVYDLNLTAYASYLDSFMDRMSNVGINIDYLGPWNEDPADESDHRKVFDQMLNLGGTAKVGLERWGLQTSVNDVEDVMGQINVSGSHFYDDDAIAESSWESTWQQLVNKSSNPVWYTEATRYSTNDGIENLIAGMNNIFPAIRGGVENVTFYQVVKRFVWANGTALPIKYSGFKNLVNNASGKRVVPSNSSINDVKVIAFAKNKSLSLHFINLSTNNKTTRIELQSGYEAQGTVTRTIWTSSDTESSNSYNLGGNSAWNVTIPAESYVHINVPLNNNAGN